MVRRAAGARRSARTTGDPEVAIRSGRKRRSSNMRASACALRSISALFDATLGIFRKSNRSSRISFSCCSRQVRTRPTASSGAARPSALTTAATNKNHLSFMRRRPTPIPNQSPDHQITKSPDSKVSVPSAGLLFAKVLHLKLLHVAIVLLEGPGEFVRAVVPAHKIQEVGIGGVQHCFKRGTSRRGNRSRRQPRI